MFQILALFPGVSRSGMTISAGLFSGIEKEKAVVIEASTTKWVIASFGENKCKVKSFETGKVYKRKIKKIGTV